MADFIYKTRGNRSPQGKVRVYFSSHPDDAHLFDTIADEVLALADCAVYRKASAFTDKDEHLSMLSEMALVIIPVTRKLLTERCDAVTVELPFTRKQHIPIFPIVMESGLVGLYGEIFGDLQFLDKTAKDETAISYEEKFKSHLTTVIYGSTFRDEITKAFDAYIFLSYRKKDRKYAKELMRLIHDNDFCRDIAIWYDEFLVPGEDFNLTIAEALEKSELFVMAVTPNLVNEKNYVMTTEYPMAKKNDKAILPVEMEKTGGFSLKMKYPKLPTVVNGGDPAALARALSRAFSRVACLKNDSDPEHNYRIATAYLLGIDVERDPKRALSLFEKAAKQGSDQAIGQLVRMYSMGEGTARDHDKALAWEEVRLEKIRKQYEEDPRMNKLINYVSALRDFAAMCQASGRLDKSVKANEKILTLNAKDQSWLYSTQVECCIEIGSCYLTKSDYEKARSYYEKGLSISENIVYFITRRQKQVNLYQALGKLEVALSHLPAARAYFEKAIPFLTDPLYDLDQPPQEAFSYYLDYGTVLFMLNDLEKSENSFLKSLEYADRITAEKGDWALEDALGRLYLSLGSICLNQGNLPSAQYYAQKGTDYLEGWYELFGLPSTVALLSQGYRTLAILNNALQNPENARKMCEKCLSACKSAAKAQNTVFNRLALADAHKMLGDKENLNCAVAILEAVQKETNDRQTKLTLAQCYIALGNLSLNAPLTDISAPTHFTSATELLHSVCRVYDTTDVKKALGDAYLGLGSHQAKYFRFDQAIPFYLKALNWYLAVAEENPAHTAKQDVVAIYQQLYSAENALFHYDNAAKYLRLSLEYCDLLLQDSNIAPARYTAAASYFNASVFFAMHGDKDSAVSCADRAILLWRALADEFPFDASYTAYLTMAEQQRATLC